MGKNVTAAGVCLWQPPVFEKRSTYERTTQGHVIPSQAQDMGSTGLRSTARQNCFGSIGRSGRLSTPFKPVKGVRALKREISGVEYRIEEAGNRLRAIDATVDEVNKGISSLQGRLLVLGNGINGLGEQAKEIEAEVSSLRASVNYMGTQLSTINSELSTMQKKLSLLQYP